MRKLMHSQRERLAVRTTVTLEDDLFAQAMSLAAPGTEKAELLRQCVQAFIQRQTARRLIALGGQAPEIELAPRRPVGEPAA